MNGEITRIICDVLVVGSGCAGLKAAITASGSGVDTLVVSNLASGRGGSSFYPLTPPWGINYAKEDRDDKQHFFDEIMGISRGCIDADLTQILVDRSYDSFQELVSYGVPFVPASSIHLIACFGDNPRGDLLLDIELAASRLMQTALQTGVRFMDSVEVVDLVVQDGTCQGALAIGREGQLFFLESKSTVLATGGAEGLWTHSFSRGDTLGSGYAMAARHGALFVNLEFVQFIPGTLHPVRGINFFHPLFAHSPKLYNSASQTFLEKYLPEGLSEQECLRLRSQHGPFHAESPSRFFELAMLGENLEVKDKDLYGCRLAFDNNPGKEVNNRFWRELMNQLGIDAWESQLRIYPHCQAFNGGIVIDRDAKTAIDGVYACGEAAGGIHGANRLGGNSILATQVFGKIAGQRAAEGTKKTSKPKIKNRYLLEALETAFAGRQYKCQPEETKVFLQSIMQKDAFLKRDEKTLHQALRQVQSMEEECNPFSCDGGQKSQEFVLAFRVKNALLAAELILSSMLERRETLGGHYRIDYENIPDSSSLHRIQR